MCDAYLLHSNLGGQGPETTQPQSIRYVNVAAVSHHDGTVTRFDLELTTTSTGYTPFDGALNGFDGCLARLSLDCNSAVDLRVTMVRSCASYQSCNACEDVSRYPTPESQIICYASGCSCYGKAVWSKPSCLGTKRQEAKDEYFTKCETDHSEVIVLPREALVSMTIFDFDTGADGQAGEQLTVPVFAQKVIGLRRSENKLIHFNEATNTFTAIAPQSQDGPPTNLQEITSDQAARSVQLFFTPEVGYIDATFKATRTSGICEGSTLYFAGDSSLCAPPPLTVQGRLRPAST